MPAAGLHTSVMDTLTGAIVRTTLRAMEVNGEALRAIREAQGWSKSRLAAKAEISLPYLRDLEKGRRKGRNPAIVKMLAKALNVPTAAITRRSPGAD